MTDGVMHIKTNRSNYASLPAYKGEEPTVAVEDNQKEIINPLSSSTVKNN